MTLFQIILKLIGHFGLLPTKDRQQLTTDVEQFESTATPDSEDKIKALYGKMHAGLYIRLALPFVYFYLVKSLKDMMSEDDGDFLEE